MTILPRVGARASGGRARRGAYLVVAAIGLAALAAGGAVVVETRWRDLTLSQARGASEAAAHAAAVALAHGATLDEARDLASAVAAEHPVAGRAARVDPLQDVAFGLWDFEGRAFDPTAGRVNAVEVRVHPRRDPLRWLFGGAERTAAARAALRSRDVVVALDLADPSAAEPALRALADRLAFLALPDERLAVVSLADLDTAEASGWLGGERPLAARTLVVVSDSLCADTPKAARVRALARALGEDGVHVSSIGVGAGAATDCLGSLVSGFGRSATVADADAVGAALEDVTRGVPVALVTP